MTFNGNTKTYKQSKAPAGARAFRQVSAGCNRVWTGHRRLHPQFPRRRRRRRSQDPSVRGPLQELQVAEDRNKNEVWLDSVPAKPLRERMLKISPKIGAKVLVVT
ncbi:uncharacterized protein LOC143038334 [Oratosquilla oratoria]|uniref:uncharacterized protein LOC143038334 n=1 Tax=Oratosquilla oratoria TaxID=337810 RepID=UPI003F768614